MAVYDLDEGEDYEEEFKHIIQVPQIPQNQPIPPLRLPPPMPAVRSVSRDKSRGNEPHQRGGKKKKKRPRKTQKWARRRKYKQRKPNRMRARPRRAKDKESIKKNIKAFEPVRRRLRQGDIQIQQREPRQLSYRPPVNKTLSMSRLGYIPASVQNIDAVKFQDLFKIQQELEKAKFKWEKDRFEDQKKQGELEVKLLKEQRLKEEGEAKERRLREKEDKLEARKRAELELKKEREERLKSRLKEEKKEVVPVLYEEGLYQPRVLTKEDSDFVLKVVKENLKRYVNNSNYKAFVNELYRSVPTLRRVEGAFTLDKVMSGYYIEKGITDSDAIASDIMDIAGRANIASTDTWSIPQYEDYTNDVLKASINLRSEYGQRMRDAYVDYLKQRYGKVPRPAYRANINPKTQVISAILREVSARNGVVYEDLLRGDLDTFIEEYNRRNGNVPEVIPPVLPPVPPPVEEEEEFVTPRDEPAGVIPVVDAPDEKQFEVPLEDPYMRGDREQAMLRERARLAPSYADVVEPMWEMFKDEKVREVGKRNFDKRISALRKAEEVESTVQLLRRYYTRVLAQEQSRDVRVLRDAFYAWLEAKYQDVDVPEVKADSGILIEAPLPQPVPVVQEEVEEEEEEEEVEEGGDDYFNKFREHVNTAFRNLRIRGKNKEYLYSAISYGTLFELLMEDDSDDTDAWRSAVSWLMNRISATPDRYPLEGDELNPDLLKVIEDTLRELIREGKEVSERADVEEKKGEEEGETPRRDAPPILVTAPTPRREKRGEGRVRIQPYIIKDKRDIVELNGKGKFYNSKYKKLEPLYTSQIDMMMNSYRPEGYLGVFAVDEIPEIYPSIKDLDQWGFIYNTDPSTEEGKHWIAVFFSNNSKDLSIYDSLADPIQKRVIKDLKDAIEKLDLPYLVKLKYNAVRDQRANSVSCGLFAMKYLMSRFNGMSHKEASEYNSISQGENEVRASFGYI